MVLPVTLHYHDHEAPIDFVARLAVANGFASLRDFIDHTETSAAAIVAGDACALSMVSEWSGVPNTRLTRWVASSKGVGSTWRLGSATLSKEMRSGRRMRFCAGCVLNDRMQEPGRLAARAYRRVWWNVRAIKGCPVHDCALTEISVGTDIDLHDFSSFVNDNVERIEQFSKGKKPNRQPSLDRFLIDRINGVGQHGFLQNLEAYVATDFSHHLGEFLIRHKVAGYADGATDSIERGYALASRSEAEIRTVFEEVIARKRPTTKYVERFLGLMVIWLRRNLDKTDYQPAIDLLQELMERNMPFGQGQVIFRPVLVRHVYCVNSAHADFHLPKARIRALMKAHDPEFRDELANSSTYFDAKALVPIIEEARATLNSTEAAAELGLISERVLDLLKAGILEQVEAREGEERSFARIPRCAISNLVGTLESKLTQVATEDGLLSLTRAVARFHRPFYAIVKLILDGELDAFIIAGEEPLFRRIRVKRDALENEGGFGAGSNEHLMRLQEVERELGTTLGTVKELVTHGFLHETIVRRDTGRRVRFIERSSFNAFKAAHVSLSAIRKARQGYRGKIIAELGALGVAPVNKAEGANGRFYSRADLSRVGYDI